MIKILFLLLISTACFGQAKDTTQKKVDTAAIQRQQMQAMVQAIEFVLADMKTTLYGKLSADEYAALIKIQEAYIKEKNTQFNPKPKK